MITAIRSRMGSARMGITVSVGCLYFEHVPHLIDECIPVKRAIIPRPHPPPGHWGIYEGTVLFRNTFAGKLQAADYSKLVVR